MTQPELTFYKDYTGCHANNRLQRGRGRNEEPHSDEAVTVPRWNRVAPWPEAGVMGVGSKLVWFWISFKSRTNKLSWLIWCRMWEKERNQRWLPGFGDEHQGGWCYLNWDGEDDEISRFGVNIRCSRWGMVSLKCLWDIEMKLWSVPFDIRAWSLGGKPELDIQVQKSSAYRWCHQANPCRKHWHIQRS